MKPLTARERRLLAVALLVVAVAAGWFGLILPIASGVSARAADRAALRAAYLRDEQVLATAPIWRAALTAQRRTAARFAITAPTRSEAEDSLRRRVAEAVANAGGKAGAIDALTPPNDAAVAVRADASLTLAQLSSTLRRLEDQEPYVVIDYLSVSAEAAFRTGRAGPMDVRIEASAAYVSDPGARP